MKKVLVLIVTGIFLSATIAFAGSKIFSDVRSNEWYSAAVTSLSEKDIIAGYNDDTFRPANPVTRAEIAVMLDRLIRYFESKQTSSGRFTAGTEEFYQYPLIIKNLDPAVYNSVKFFINDVPYHVQEIGQNKTWDTHFFAGSQFTLTIEARGYQKPFPTVSREFTSQELIKEHPECQAIKRKVLSIEVEIRGRDDISFKIGEGEFICPL